MGMGWMPQEDNGDEEDDGDGLMAAYGCLRALSTVLDSVSSMPALFPQLEAILFPVMQRLCSTDGQDVFEEVLEIIAYFTYFSATVRRPSIRAICGGPVSSRQGDCHVMTSWV
jgi:hypothetical protein